MCELLNSGKTIKEIAAQFNICDVAVRSAIKTALRKNEAVVDAKYSFGKNAKRSRSKNKNKKVLTQKTVLKPSFPAFAISEMKSVLDSILDSNMDNSSKLAIIKTVLGQK
jgi:transposase-like protein